MRNLETQRSWATSKHPQYIFLMKLTYKLFHNLNEVKTSGMWFLYDVPDFPDFGRTCAVKADTERLLCSPRPWKLEHWSRYRLWWDDAKRSDIDHSFPSITRAAILFLMPFGRIYHSYKITVFWIFCQLINTFHRLLRAVWSVF